MGEEWAPEHFDTLSKQGQKEAAAIAKIAEEAKAMGLSYDEKVDINEMDQGIEESKAYISLKECRIVQEKKTY